MTREYEYILSILECMTREVSILEVYDERGEYTRSV